MPIIPKTQCERFLYNTVRLDTEAQSESGEEYGCCGTGFFYAAPHDGSHELFLVTNEHVLHDAYNLVFTLHESTRHRQIGLFGDETHEVWVPSGRSYDCTVAINANMWFQHPNAEIDLAVLPWRIFQQESEREGRRPYIQALFDEDLASEQLLNSIGAIQNVVMVGYPDGLWDNINNFPVFRMGTTASHPALSFQIEGQGLLDIACFSGSSGSPVFLYHSKFGLEKTRFTADSGEKAYLLGILAKAGVMDNGTIAAAAVSAGDRDTHLNLGYYVRADKLSELAQYAIQQMNQTE